MSLWKVFLVVAAASVARCLPLPTRVLRTRWAPSKVKVFARLLVQSRVHNRDVIDEPGTGCPLCDAPLETASHMVSTRLWTAVSVIVPPTPNRDGGPPLLLAHMETTEKEGLPWRRPVSPYAAEDMSR
jgi:hypothetical protein